MGETSRKRIRTSTLIEYKESGKKFACLTSYDQITASIFDEAGIEVLLVGDSAANNALGYEDWLPITVDEMVSLGRAVSSAAKHSLVIVDMPFGSYEGGPEIALENAIKIMKQTGAQGVKLEGGERSKAQIEALVTAGIPVMGHIGFTPQSVHTLGGFKVQGRGDSASELLRDALAVEAAGAFAVVLEMVPEQIATEVSSKLRIPTIGIGAGAGTDAQILVWTDFAGMNTGRSPKFVKKYLELRGQLLAAATEYRNDVAKGAFPSKEHSFES